MKQQFILPELYCPFPSQINKYADVLEEYALEWVLRFNLLVNKSTYQNFCKSQFFMLVANAYPYCQLEELKIANDLLSWIIIWDDQCDLSDLRKQPELLNNFHNRFIEILNGAELNSKDIPLSHALIDLRQRILQIASKKWFNYFVHTVKDYFHGCFQEATIRTQEIIPDISSYIIIRRSTVAVAPFLLLSELYNQLVIFDILQHDEIAKKLKIMTIDVIAWCNDIFSVSREVASGEVQNLALVLHYQQQIPLEQAINIAAEMHNQEIKKIMDLEELSINSSGEEIKAEMTKYISGLHTWIRANINWHSKSARYHDLERLELVKC